MVELNCGSSLHLLRACCKEQRTDLLACIRQYQSLITLAMNQEFRMHYDESFFKREKLVKYNEEQGFIKE